MHKRKLGELDIRLDPFPLIRGNRRLREPVLQCLHSMLNRKKMFVQWVLHRGPISTLSNQKYRQSDTEEMAEILATTGRLKLNYRGDPRAAPHFMASAALAGFTKICQAPSSQIT